MKKTPNLGLPLTAYGHVPTEQSFKKAMLLIDASFGESESAGRELMLAEDAEDAREILGTGGIAAAQADSVAATVGALVTDFNALLAKMRAAGQMATTP